MQENDDQFSGDELDESPKSIDEETESISEEMNSKGIWAKHSGKKSVSLCIALGLCLLIGIGYFYLKEETYDMPQEEETTQLHRLKIPEAQLLIFPSFVIPLKEKKGFTYISLSISLNVPNKELREEIIAKKEQLRGIIYDILREEINKTEEIPPLEKIKGFLTTRVNMALSAGKVNEIYITKFLAV